ncbi:MAG: transporter substrate-binding domain-containing protein [Melioribacteraceae bacterium]|nr:transporter substrate-binding domain-containing protein [Melioribacteraceae bacterium]
MKKLILFLALLNLNLIAQEKTFIVGTKITEPFVIHNNSDDWSGISFELWKLIAKDLNIKFEVRTYDLEGLTNAVAKNEIDIAVSPLTVTAEREKLFDFTHSYFTTGLSIAVPNKSNNSLFNIARNIFSTQFIEVVLLVAIVLFIVGFFVWLFERKKNKAEFGDGFSKGLGSSFWWAAVTMTTVGYGDKSPKTAGGRIIALIWMFAGLIMISGFTAAIASALTVEKLDTGINTLTDLNNVRVGTVRSSSSEEYLSQNGIDFITTKNIDHGFDLIENKQIDAFVYDAPILKYYVKSKNIANKFRVLPIILDPINYAFALPTNSNLRESINRVLLREIDKKEWKTVVNNYLGGQ